MLPFTPQNPDAVRYATWRLIADLQVLHEKYPTKSDELLKKHKDEVLQRTAYANELGKLLNDTSGLRRLPVHAEHFDTETQARTPLHVSLVQFGSDWTLIDWTAPTRWDARGQYHGRKRTDSKQGLLTAVKEWNARNRYRAGRITYDTTQCPELPPVQGHFDTDGLSTLDELSVYFDYAALAALGVAGVVTLLAPVPGSRVVSFAIWSSVFSSTAASSIRLAQNYQEGNAEFTANAVDVLSVIGNLCGLGAAGSAWKKGALLTVPGLGRRLFVGQVTADALQGIIILPDIYDRVMSIMTDGMLTPCDRISRAAALLLTEGALLAVNMKAAAADLKTLRTAPKFAAEAGTPEARLRAIGEDGKEIVLSVPPGEGHVKQSSHDTVVHLDADTDPLLRTRVHAPAPDKPAVAYVNGIAVEPKRIGDVYHGTDITFEQALEVLENGLPARGPNRELVDHVNHMENKGFSASAFRGSTVALVTTETQGAGKFGPVAFKLSDMHGWDVLEALEGRVQRYDQDGAPIHGPAKTAGEAELVIEARVPPEKILGFYMQVETGGGRTRWKFFPNPNLKDK